MQFGVVAVTSGAFVLRHRAGIASSVAPMLAVASLVIYAAHVQGNPPRQAHLNDSSVWVSTDDTSATSGTTGTPAMFGAMNVPASQFSASLVPTSGTTHLDVVQDGSAIAGINEQSDSLVPIDPSRLRLRPGGAIPIGSATAQIGGGDRTGTLAILDPVKGAVWAMTVDPGQSLPDLSVVNPTSAKPVARVGARAAMAIANDGSVAAVSPSLGVTTLAFARSRWVSHSRALPKISAGALTVTTVGTQAVAMSLPQASDSPIVVLPDGQTVTLTHDAPGGDAVLQQPGPDADEVLVNTAHTLLGIDLKTHKVRAIIAGTGSPAAPVRFEDCDFAAWSGPSPSEIRSCPGDPKPVVKPLASMTGSPVADLIFRENHDQLLLNDRTSGQVWNDADGNPEQIADWQAVQRPAQSNQSGTQNTTSIDDKTKGANANDDNLGARPGRVTTLHVLDNDKSPDGTVVTVANVYAPSTASAIVSVAPDRQSVLVSLPDNATGPISFQYDDSTGAKVSNKATVTVNVVPPGTFAAPALREGAVEPTWSVPANGVVTIPVLDDWRVNPTGDAPALGSLTAASVTAAGASAVSTADGSILYSAGKDPGNDTIAYPVLDGDKSTVDHLHVQIQGPDDAPKPPVAENDFVQAVVGEPTSITPLANDLPGSDPRTQNAVLRIAGTIKGQAGLQVSPPTPSGSVVITATAVGDYLLPYQDSYGSVNSAKPAFIRVDAAAADPQAKVVAAPDAVTVRGQSASILDPLTNDSSPHGELLTVVGVSIPDSTTDLEVAVVRGHYLRVNAREARDVPTSEAFDYSVTDGATTATTQVVVNELPALDNDAPVAETDHAIVRAGDSVTIPVLDNDIDSGGDSLSLVKNVAGAPAPGQLVVTGSGTAGQQLGSAFVSGDVVRYAAPPANPAVTQEQQVTIAYTAINGTSQTASGTAIVTIRPTGTVATDQPPQPQDLEARIVAGGTVVIPVPTSGVDPDGDSVQVQGLALTQAGDPEPKLGALIASTANSLTYQAYPSVSNAGTDTFSYQVTDTYGLTATAQVRVAVVQPTVLPAPVAHDVALTAAPNSDVQLDVVTPKYVDYPDGAPPILIDPAKASSTAGAVASLFPNRPGWLRLKIPASAPGNVLAIPYSVVGDLGAPSGATIRVQLQPGFAAPPVVVDEFAKPKPGTNTVSVNLLAGDYSPVGRTLSVAPRAGVAENKLTVTLTGVPQAIPFIIRDDAGATATALAYIPASGTNARPYWNGKPISIPEAKATIVSIGDYIVDPQGHSLSLTDRQKIWGSPTPGLSAAITSATQVSLNGATGYQGPASVTIAVTRTGNLNDYTVITIPVVVGTASPVLRCPTDVIDVQEGLTAGSTLSPASQCHVYTPLSISPGALRFHLSWAKDPGRVTFPTNDAFQDVIFADHSATPGSTGVLSLSVDGYPSLTAHLSVMVIPAPALTLKPVDMAGILTTGQPTVIDLHSYVESPFGASAISLVSFGQITGAQVAKSGQATLSIRVTDPQLHGVARLPYIVTDATGTQASARERPGNISLQFIGVPGSPTAVTPRPGFLSGQVPVSWVAPASNGSPIDMYEVSYTSQSGGGSSGKQTCHASCAITGLHNGADYTFSVRAHNTAGWGLPTAGAGVGTPDTIPSQVTGFTVGSPPKDGALDLSWTPVTGAASTKGFFYQLTYSGGISGSQRLTDPTAHALTVPGLNNDAVETFTIVAGNQAGQALPTTTVGQSAGTPAAPTLSAGDFTPTKTASGASAVIVTWGVVPDPNGPGATTGQSVTYTLTRTDDGGGNPVVVCKDSTNTSCTDSGLETHGQFYRYMVTSANKWNTSPASAPARVEVSTPPEQMGRPTVDTPTPDTDDGTVTLHFQTVNANGSSLTVHCAYTNDSSTPTTASTACPGSPWSGYAPAGGTPDMKTLTGLGNGATVEFTVWEDNGSSQNTQYKSGPVSDASAGAETNAPPNAPTGGTCSLGGSSGDDVTFAWKAPSMVTRPIRYSYSIQDMPRNGTVVTGNDSDTTLTKTFPEDGDQRTITLQTVDSKGEKSPSTDSFTCPDKDVPQPTAPTNPTCSRQNTVVTFSWSAAMSTNYSYQPYTYNWTGAYSGSTQGTSTSHDFDPDGGSNTINVTTTDAKGRTSTSSLAVSCSDAPHPALVVSQGGHQTTSYCGVADCKQIIVSGSGFRANHTYTLWYNTDCGGSGNPQYAACTGGANSGENHYASEQVPTDGNGNLSSNDRSIGYGSTNVWTDIDDNPRTESNHAPFS